MTFYWWSHWFWITILGFACVNSYPSQEISGELTKEGPTKTTSEVTKLYQTTAEFSWSTSVSPDIVEKTILKSISSAKDLDDLLDGEEIDVDEALDDDGLDDSFNTEVENIVKKEEERTEDSINEEGEDYKRSAEILSKTNENLDLEYDLTKGSIKVLKEEIIETFATPINQSKEDIQTPVESNISRTIDSDTGKDTKSINPNPKDDEVGEDKIKTSAATPSTPKIINSNHSIFIENVTTQAPYILSNSTEPVEEIHKVPFTLENVNREDEIRRAENEHRTRKPKVLSADYKNINRVINYSSQTKSLLTRSASTEANQYTDNNIASEALSVQRTYFLDASAISAICFTIFGVCCTIGTIGIVLYRRRYLNKPQTLSEPDSSVYIDDSTLRVSDNSDEMYSLDNDSFLNSLEAMTIQNYWTDTVKHTKL